MQRLACREYAASHPDWEIIEEISEKGISGYKISTNARDAIIEIKHRATLRQFDVLLVFMFDRIGRRDDETPFVVQWFVQQGIEVWSAREGEQRFDNHVDKLLNYIRFWQASGESEKTATADGDSLPVGGFLHCVICLRYNCQLGGVSFSHVHEEGLIPSRDWRKKHDQ